MNHSLFSSPSFLQNGNIYEVNIRQYTAEGTFNAFLPHMPRLKDMGVEILWLMPVHPIGKIKRKGTLGSYYSICDHRAVNPEFGTEQDFRNLVQKVHESGMKIIMDWVANHTSWDHVWTISNPEFFIRDEEGNFKSPHDWDDVIQINHADQNEQAAMIDAMAYWLTDFDIDGFRADLAHLTPLKFWKDARLKLTPLKKDLIWLAETEEPSYHEAFDISYTWKWMHTTEKYAKKEITLPDCINILNEYKNDFPSNALRLFFTSNHDENSWNGTEYEKYGVNAKAFAVFSCTYPGMPLVYSGQELPNNQRLKFFEKDAIEWGTLIELHEFYKVLFGLRKRNKAISAPTDNMPVFYFEVEKDILVYSLTKDEDQVYVFLNLSTETISSEIHSNNLNGKYRNIFTGEISELNSAYTFDAPPGHYIVLERIHQQ